MRSILFAAASLAGLCACATPRASQPDASPDPVPLGLGAAEVARAPDHREPVPLELGAPVDCAAVRAQAAAMLTGEQAALANLLAEPDQLTRELPAIGPCQRVPDAAVAEAVAAWVRSLGDAEGAGLRVGCAEHGTVLVEAHARRAADQATFSVVGHVRGARLTPLVSGSLRGREGARVEARGVADLDRDGRADVLVVEWRLGASGPAQPTTSLFLAAGQQVDASTTRTNDYAHFVAWKGRPLLLTGPRQDETVFLYRVRRGELEADEEAERDLGERIGMAAWRVNRLRELASRPDSPEQPHFEGADLLAPLTEPARRCLAGRLTREQYDFELEVRRPHQDDEEGDGAAGR